MTWESNTETSLRHSLNYFGNANKFDREKWVVNSLLSSLKIAVNDSDLVKADEPADVAYFDAMFQVKEILDQGRKRTKEFKDKLSSLERLMLNKEAAARTVRLDDDHDESSDEYAEIIDPYRPTTLSFNDVISDCVDYAISLQQKYKYGIREIVGTDLVIYFNKLNSQITSGSEGSIQGIEFRSLSIVTNAYCSVVFAKDNSPNILRNNVGMLFDFVSPLDLEEGKRSYQQSEP